MRAWWSFRTWISDPRTGVAVALSLIAAGVIAAVLMLGFTARDALGARQRTAEAAARRIDLLQAELRDLRRALVVGSAEAGRRDGLLSAQIAALQEQVEQEGGDPVVPRTTTTTRSATTTTSTTTSTSTTTTTQPPDDCRIQIAGICIP